MGLLDDILAQKADEIAAMRSSSPPARPSDLAVRDVARALQRVPGTALRLIAEIKFRSPSAGTLSRKLSAADRARTYEAAGAAMVSVLTDAKWFDGSFADLRAAREAVGVPILCKDFIIDAAQIDRAWASGADAVLLIARCIRSERLPSLIEYAKACGLEPFVEVVDEPELDRALEGGARLIGVNARDLDTLQMDAERTTRVLARIPSGRIAVHLSGVKSNADARQIAASRADAALIGTALMRRDDPGPLLAELVAGASSLT
jgi:indole-3-glycerol phosphate synthase